LNDWRDDPPRQETQRSKDQKGRTDYSKLTLIPLWATGFAPPRETKGIDGCDNEWTQHCQDEERRHAGDKQTCENPGLRQDRNKGRTQRSPRVQLAGAGRGKAQSRSLPRPRAPGDDIA
jgi:hypothetical protein